MVDREYFPDKGCKQATDYLGHQSSCLQCPFPKCVYDELRVGVIRANKRTRNEEIRERFYKGESVADLAKAFGVHKRTIQRIVSK